MIKLMWRFFLDSRSDNKVFRSDLVTRLRTLASSRMYSCGGPSFSTSNSEAAAGRSKEGTGQKLMASDRAAAARPWWRWEIQVFLEEEDDGEEEEEEKLLSAQTKDLERSGSLGCLGNE